MPRRMELRPDLHPWERQEPHETELQYARFLVYRDLGPECDRLRQTVEVLNSTGDKATYGNIKSVMSVNRWQARAAAWDRYNIQADRARMIKLRREAIDMQRKAARRLREQALIALDKLDLDKLAPADLARFIDLSFKIEHSIFAEVDAPAINADAEAGEVVDIASWSPAERRRRLELLRDELAKRATRAADDDEVA